VERAVRWPGRRSASTPALSDQRTDVVFEALVAGVMHRLQEDHS